MNVHKNAVLTPSGRALLVQRYLAGESAVEVAEAMGLSPPTTTCGSPNGFRQDDLRHRRVTSWLADGKSPALVQEAMGHATIQTTLKYTHFANSHLWAVV